MNRKLSSKVIARVISTAAAASNSAAAWGFCKTTQPKFQSMMAGIALAVVFGVFDSSMPCNAAAFLQGIIDYGTTAGWPTTPTTIVVNALRMLAMLVVGTGLFQAYQAYREGSEWQVMLKNPAVAIASVVIGDVITNVITGK